MSISWLVSAEGQAFGGFFPSFKGLEASGAGKVGPIPKMTKWPPFWQNIKAGVEMEVQERLKSDEQESKQVEQKQKVVHALKECVPCAGTLPSLKSQ